MHNFELDRVEFYSKEDLGGSSQLKKGENILKDNRNINYDDINDILEIYNLKKYFDNDLYLRDWTEEDITNFKRKVSEYSNFIGKYFASICDLNITDLYEKIILNYINSFWELVNNQKVYKRISRENFKNILVKEPHLIQTILKYKNLVEHYDYEIKNFLIGYPQSAEILLNYYEVQENFPKALKNIPKSLTIEEKEKIISNYIDYDDVNLNYLELIQNASIKNDFRISDKTRLKAKRKHQSKTEIFFKENGGFQYGVSIKFPKGATKIKDGYIDENHIIQYSYSYDFIKLNNNPYLLFRNFKFLFEYIDHQNRINLISRKSNLGVLERFMGVHSISEYRAGAVFSLSEMTSQGQLISYNKIVNELGTSLEEIIQFIYTVYFQQEYNYATNAHFYIPKSTSTYFEKVRVLAPEFERLLKQFKLFVEDGSIDFELLEMSSSPVTIKDIPSLNKYKYLYLNQENSEIVTCSNILFSDQTHLSYVELFEDKNYRTFFDLLINEEICFKNFKEYQKPSIQYLIEMGFIIIDKSDVIQVVNFEKILILKDLYENEFASYYHYEENFREEAIKLIDEKTILSECSLFSKQEQAYFNYFLNKSEFTNGQDLRNRYLHGTQANPSETEIHESSYFIYLKLFFLTMLKMEDDLRISSMKI